MRLLFVALLLFAFPAFAQVNEIPPECRILPEHKLDTGVNYKPGVDVHGKPVVPADINAAPIAVPETMVVPLTIDLAQRLQGMNIPGLQMDSTLGFLEIRQDGRVTYNDKDITSQVYVLCGKKPDVAPPATDRQTPPDIIEYPPVKEIKPVPTVPPAAPTPPKKVEEAPKGELIEGGDYAE